MHGPENFFDTRFIGFRPFPIQMFNKKNDPFWRIFTKSFRKLVEFSLPVWDHPPRRWQQKKSKVIYFSLGGRYRKSIGSSGITVVWAIQRYQSFFDRSTFFFVHRWPSSVVMTLFFSKLFVPVCRPWCGLSQICNFLLGFYTNISRKSMGKFWLFFDLGRLGGRFRQMSF